MVFAPFRQGLVNFRVDSLLETGRMRLVREEDPAANAKQAEGASWVALRTPIPIPQFTCYNYT